MSVRPYAFVLVIAFFPAIAAGQGKKAAPVRAKAGLSVDALVLQGRIPEAARLASKTQGSADNAVRKLLELVDTQITDRQIPKAEETLRSTEAFTIAYSKSAAAKPLSADPIKGRRLRLQGIKLNDDKQYEQAEKVLRQALDLSRQIQDSRLEGGVHNNLGISLQFQEKLEEAMREFDAARQIAEGQNDALRAGSYNFNLGKVFYQLSRHEQALQAFKRAMDQNKSAGKADLEARATMMAGMAQSKLDIINSEALKYFEKALQLFGRLGDKRNAGWIYYLMGDHIAYSQKFADAALYGEKAVPLLVAANDVSGLIPCYEFLGDMYGRTGEKEKSEHFKKLADELSRKASATPKK